jgi:hypothetical protein
MRSFLKHRRSFLNLHVADIWACYKQWGDKGACFLTEPLNNHGWELLLHARSRLLPHRGRPIYSNRPRLVQQPRLIWQATHLEPAMRI